MLGRCLALVSDGALQALHLAGELLIVPKLGVRLDDQIDTLAVCRNVIGGPTDLVKNVALLAFDRHEHGISAVRQPRVTNDPYCCSARIVHGIAVRTAVRPRRRCYQRGTPPFYASFGGARRMMRRSCSNRS